MNRSLRFSEGCAMNTVTADLRKSERYRLHHWLSTRSCRAGAATCMHVLAGAGSVTVGRTGAGAVHVSGVQRCASVWACPVCAPTIRERRATEVDQVVRGALDAGHVVYFVTATVSHKLGDHLSDVLNLVTESWRATFSGRRAQSLRGKGYVGQIRNIEVTHGVNGWHPHIHATLIFDRDADETVTALGRAFSTAVASRGGISIVPGPGWSWSRVETASAVSAYLAKVEGGWGIGLEMARGDLKLSRGAAGRTPGQILTAAADGCPDAAVLFRIYEECTKGRNFMRFSRGLKATFGVVEVSDEEAAELAPVDELEVTWTVAAVVWYRIVRSGQLGPLLVRARTCPATVDVVSGELLALSG